MAAHPHVKIRFSLPPSLTPILHPPPSLTLLYPNLYCGNPSPFFSLSLPPILDGKFTPQQRVVYDTVLAAQKAVLGAMKPGVVWPVRGVGRAEGPGGGKL